MNPTLKVAALLIGAIFAGAAFGQTSTSNSGSNSSAGVVANPVNTNMGNGASTSSSGSFAGATSQTTGNEASLGVTVQQDFSTPGSQTITHTGTTTENINTEISGKTTVKNVPNVIAPNILPTSPCMGSTSLGGAVAGFGIGGGTSWKDADCGYRETARVFLQANMPQDGIAVLCTSEYASNAPACKALAKKAADDAARPVVANAKQDVIRTGNDAGRNATQNGTMSKSQFDKEITVALVSGDKAAQCDVYRRSGDQFIMARMGCSGK